MSCFDKQGVRRPIQLPNRLQQLPVKIISDEVCGRDDWYGERFNASTMMCAGYAAGITDTCTGDTGGPLQCLADNGKWMLTGIASWSRKPCGMPKKPTVYTRVRSLFGFIGHTVYFTPGGTVYTIVGL